MKTSVVEPLQSAIDRISIPDIPSLHMPPAVAEHLPAAVTEHLPERFRPAPKSRSKWPLVLILIAVAVVLAVRYSRRRQEASGDVGSHNGSSPSYSSDASFVDVR